MTARYGVIVCPKCGMAKGVEADKKTTTCPCGRDIEMKRVKLMFLTDSPLELAESVAKANASLRGGGQMPSEKRSRKKDPYAEIADRAKPIAENILSAVAKKEGIEWRAIPTKGGSEVMTAVVGKYVDFGFSGGTHPPFVKAGDMIVLAGLGQKRLLASPEVPTLTEYGYDLFFDNDNILFVPKGTPDDVTKKLTAAVEKAAKDPKYVELLQTKFLIPALCLTGDELTKSIQDGSKANQRMLDALK